MDREPNTQYRPYFNDNPEQKTAYKPYFDKNVDPDEAIRQLTSETLNLQLTIEEVKTLKECQRNSVMQRGLPLGFTSMGGVYYLMKTGVMKKSKFMLAFSGISGFLMGTLSYRQVCLDKLMALPNSTLKERIMIAQGKQPQVRVELPAPESQSWFDSVLPNNEPAPMTSSLDIEPYNQSHRYDGFSSSLPDADTAYAVDPPLQPIGGSHYSTYDELRQKNREEYERSRNRGPQKSNNPPRPPSSDPHALPVDRPYDSLSSQPPKQSDDFL